MKENIRRVLIVNAGSDPQILPNAYDGLFPILNVVSLATVLMRLRPDLEVRVIDGQVVPTARIVEEIGKFNADIVGVSVLGTSYENSVIIAKAAKESGAVVVFGNDYAAIMGRQILKHQESVDYICTADIGEFFLPMLIAALEGKRAIESVPQLMFRSDGEIKHNQNPATAEIFNAKPSAYVLDAIPPPHRLLASLETREAYVSGYLSKYGWLHQEGSVKGVATMNRARGCSRVKDPCAFCGIKDLSLRFSSAEAFWIDIKAGQDEVQASVFYEAYDSLSSAPRWLEELIIGKPKNLSDIKIISYSQALETTPRLVKLYKDLGVFRVNIGLESGDTDMLKRLKGPRDSVEVNKKACALYKESNIHVYGSFVLGWAGETYESLNNTIEFAKWLIDNKMLVAIEPLILYPDPGSFSGRALLNPDLANKMAQDYGFTIQDKKLLNSMPAKYGNTDSLPLSETSRDWCKIFCHVSWEELAAAVKEIRSYFNSSMFPQGSEKKKNSSISAF